MKILRTQRGLSRLQAILFGIGIRRKQSGFVLATLQAFAILAIDTFRSISGVFLKYGLFTPLRLLAKFKKATASTPTPTGEAKVAS